MNEAAKVLGVSQASLSSALKELEDEFGVHIFDRSNKGVKITRDGAEFIRYARQLISQYEVNRPLRQRKQEERPQLCRHITALRLRG